MSQPPNVNYADQYTREVVYHGGRYFTAGFSTHGFEGNGHALAAVYDLDGNRLSYRILHQGEYGSSCTNLIPMPNGTVMVSGYTKYSSYYDPRPEVRVWAERMLPNLGLLWRHEHAFSDTFSYSGPDAVLLGGRGLEPTILFPYRRLHRWNFTEYIFIDELSVNGVQLDQTRLDFTEPDDGWGGLKASTNGGPTLYMSSNHQLNLHNRISLQFQHSLELGSTIQYLISTENGDAVVGSYNYDTDISYLTRINPVGEELWSTPWLNAHVGDIHELPDGRLLVLGKSAYGVQDIIRFARFTADGVHQWTWTGRHGYESTALALMPNDCFVIAGQRRHILTGRPFLAMFQFTDNPIHPPFGVASSDEFALLSFSLGSVYPNPFNSSANVSWTLDRPGVVSLTMYDLLGRPVRTVFADQTMTAGEHSISVDGHGLASGTYILNLDAGDTGVSSRRITLVK